MYDWTGPFFYNTHTASTGNLDMAHFTDVVLQIESPVSPMVSCYIPPRRFYPAILPA